MKKHYHFVGIGGIGMGAIAFLMLDKGYKVSGSDIKENKVTASLKQKGAEIFIGHKEQNIKGADFIVLSSAINQKNAELKEAIKRKVPLIKRAKLLAQLMKDSVGVTIAGAHGKTTTTSMTAQVLTDAGLAPTIAIGGLINGTTTNALSGKGKYFVAEVDESDGSFLYFSPRYAIITNIDKEHLDYYKNFKNVIKAYRDFINNVDKNGLVIICGDDENLTELSKKQKRKFFTYGLSPDNQMTAKEIELNGSGSKFSCWYKNKFLGDVELPIPGVHNVSNALAVIALGLVLKIDFSSIRKSLRNYWGIQRRFQRIGRVNDIEIVDDYGHHPTEIKATLAAAKVVKKERLICVFQPHRYTRVQSLQKEFVSCFSDCDYLIVMDIYAASEEPIKGISAQNLADQIKKALGKPVIYIQKEGIIKHLKSIAKPGDLVITLGAGDITQIAHQLPLALAENSIELQREIIRR